MKKFLILLLSCFITSNHAISCDDDLKIIGQTNVCGGFEETYSINKTVTGGKSWIEWKVTGGEIVAINGVRIDIYRRGVQYYTNQNAEGGEILGDDPRKTVEPFIRFNTTYNYDEKKSVGPGIDLKGWWDILQTTLGDNNYVKVTVRWGSTIHSDQVIGYNFNVITGKLDEIYAWVTPVPGSGNITVTAANLGVLGVCGTKTRGLEVNWENTPPLANIGNSFKRTESTGCLSKEPILLTANVPWVQWYFIPTGSISSIKLIDVSGVIEGSTTGKLLIYPPKNGVPANGKYYCINRYGCNIDPIYKTSNILTLDLKQNPNKPKLQIGTDPTHSDRYTLISSSNNNEWYFKETYWNDFFSGYTYHGAIYTRYKSQDANMKAFVDAKNLYGCITRSDTLIVPRFPGYREDNNSEGESLLSFFPNPASDRINISLPNYVIEGKIKLQNNLGEVIKEKNIEGENVFDLNDVSPGVYFLNIIPILGDPIIKKIEVMK